MSRLSICLAALSVCAGLAPRAGADLVTWGPPHDITAAGDVSTNGTLVTARNLWANVFAAPTVNGVAFSAYAPSGWNNGGWTLLAGSTTGDSGYDMLLDSARASSGPVGNPTGTGGIRIDNLGSLVLGKTYEIQVWYCDQRLGTPTNVLDDRVMTLGSATGVATLLNGEVTNLGALTVAASTVAIEADPNNLNGAGDTVFGQYAIGTFTRTSADQLWLLVQGTHPLANNVLLPHVNALQIREIAATTTYCTAGTSTHGCVPAIGFSGTPSVAATSGFTISASNVEGLKQGLFFYGISGRNSLPWGSGGTSWLCVKAPTQRMGVQNSGGTVNLCDGVLSQDWLAFVAANPGTLGAPFSVGDVVDVQAWYRDPPAVKTTNLSDGLEFTLAP